MRDIQEGVIKTWKGQKGFGFIQPQAGGPDIFVHIKDCEQIGRTPKVGDRVVYHAEQQDDGRYRATAVSLLAGGASSSHAVPKVSATLAKKSLNKVSSVLISLLIAAAVAFGFIGEESTHSNDRPAVSSAQLERSEDALYRAISQRLSDQQVKGVGVVSKLLKDDLEGSRHQKFILTLSGGETILISHNIDLAPRIEGLRKGDQVEFYGEFEWNNRGGVVHWTHHDPRGRHIDGWLKHQGKTYQ